jgi:multiple sugar transport system substrate-binding protein
VEPFLKAGKFDLSRLDKGAVDAVRVSSGGKYLEAIPYDQNFSILFYNKGIFDKFGVGYPKDVMTWDDATDLAKKLTRTDGSVQYFGLNPGLLHRAASQFTQGMVDPKTNKAIVNNDVWKKVFEMEKGVFSIPGNTYMPDGKATNAFLKDRTLAMRATNNQLEATSKAAGLSWDIAAYPTFKEAPGKGANYDLHVIAVAANSKHQQAAVQVIASVLSDEVQTTISKSGRISVLQNDKIREDFGKDLDYMQGKNTPAIFKTTPAANFPPTEFDRAAKKIINEQKAEAVFQKGLDINSALSQAEEELNKVIEQEKK